MIRNILKSVKSVILIGCLVLTFSYVKGQNPMPISTMDGNTSRKGEIVWIDLVTNDAKASKKFFKNLLGWTFENHEDYDVSISGTKPVAGIMEDKQLLQGSKTSYWVVSASVSNVDEATRKVKSGGGKVLTEPAEIPGRGKVALVEDAQGAFFSVLHSEAGDPRATAPRNGEWMWAELWTQDPEKAVDFYTDVLGCSSKPLDDGDDQPYFVLKGEKYDFGAITRIPVKDESPIWIPVLKVENATEVSMEVKKLGGSVLINPVTVSGNKVALVTTPTGAPFLVQEWKE